MNNENTVNTTNTNEVVETNTTTDTTNTLSSVLIVIDMQNDFIDGSLGTPEAQAIVPNVKAKIDTYYNNNKPVIYTQDTHYADYPRSLEGKLLPVEHCYHNTKGWKIRDELIIPYLSPYKPIIKPIMKFTFGYNDWVKCLTKNVGASCITNLGSIEIIGLCTDICVVSNALILRAECPDTPIIVDASCCAGVTPEKHKAALEVMKSCQIEVINE